MNKLLSNTLLILSLVLTFNCANAQQVPVKISSAKLIVDDGAIVFQKVKYAKMLDSLRKTPSPGPGDTTNLFNIALLTDLLNNQLAKPFSSDHDALLNLMIAKDSCEKAVGLHMQDFKLKVLRAQIYWDLSYRYSGDESWKFTTKQIAERRNQFDSYKASANKFYQDLEELDKHNSYDYEKMKVTFNYPIK